MFLKRFLLAAAVGISMIPLHAQQIESMPFAGLEKEIASRTESTVIINFWATWCRPCVEELPDFEKFRAEYADRQAEVWLVNLDFNSAVAVTVKNFVQTRGLRSRIIHLTDTDPNDWIEKVDKDWGGNIPATLIYRSGKRLSFHPQPLTYEDLVHLISK